MAPSAKQIELKHMSDQNRIGRATLIAGALGTLITAGGGYLGYRVSESHRAEDIKVAADRYVQEQQEQKQQYEQSRADRLKEIQVNTTIRCAEFFLTLAKMEAEVKLMPASAKKKLAEKINSTCGFTVMPNEDEAARARRARAYYTLTHTEWNFDGPLGKFDKAELAKGYKVYKEVCTTCDAQMSDVEELNTWATENPTPTAQVGGPENPASSGDTPG